MEHLITPANLAKILGCSPNYIQPPQQRSIYAAVCAHRPRHSFPSP